MSEHDWFDKDQVAAIYGPELTKLIQNELKLGEKEISTKNS
jgi:hypothetical protein